MPLFGRPQNTSRKGEITESVILARLVQLGYECLIPWGHDHRYDIAIDDVGMLVRIQCKTAHYNEEQGCLEFNKAFDGPRIMKYKEPMAGLEPATGSLRMSCSTTELHRLVNILFNELPNLDVAHPLSYTGQPSFAICQQPSLT